jgi:hypothetical protein
MKTIDCSNMPKGATHKSLGTGRWYRYESGEGAYSKGWYRSTAAGNLWVKMHMGKAAKANLVALPIGESKPTEAARQRALNSASQAYADERNGIVDQALWDKRYEFGMAPLKVEGGSYVPFPEKYTDVISDGGFDPRGWGMKAEDILTKAAGHLADRAKTYDKPEGERSMEKTVQMFNTLAGTQLTTEQGWLFMVILKMVRSQQGEYKADNYEDGAAYFALAGERTE